MRPTWAIGIVIGCLLIYMGIFGLSGFGLDLVTGTPQNFTSSGWTKVGDDNNKITISANQIAITGLDCSLKGYVYKDFGANYFADFNIQVDFTIEHRNDSAWTALAPFLVCNELPLATTVDNQPRPMIQAGAYWGQALNNTTPIQNQGQWYLACFDDTNPYRYDVYNYSSWQGVTTRMHVRRTGSNAFAEFYQSNSLIRNLTLSNVSTAKFKYLVIFRSQNNIDLQTKLLYGSVSNLIIDGSSTPIPGNGKQPFTAKDLTTNTAANAYIKISTAATPNTVIAQGYTNPSYEFSGAAGSYQAKANYGSYPEQTWTFILSSDTINTNHEFQFGSTPPPPGDGYARFQAKKDNVLVQATVTIGSWSGTTKIDGSYLQFNAAAGSYTATCTGGASDWSFTLVADSEASGSPHTFVCTSTPPPPPDDPFKVIRDLFANPTFKTVELLGGVGLIAISGIMMVTGGKRNGYKPSPRPYSPYY